ncbi:MAG: aminoacyl-tRNA hydrolase, partial [Flavobacteriaceae bacterium]|nr:aminoacyl-tRNA hydrolase [Flavobacteriaceae bacterium]
MNHQNLIKELNFKAIRSSGAGGQHVNKVSSKIVLSFDIANSNEFSEEQTALLCKNLATRLTKEQVLILTSDESRSQHKNKELVIKRFL